MFGFIKRWNIALLEIMLDTLEQKYIKQGYLSRLDMARKEKLEQYILRLKI